MGIFQLIFNEINSDFLWLFLTVLKREQCLRLYFGALEQILCNLENEVLKTCKEFPVFGHNISIKP